MRIIAILPNGNAKILNVLRDATVVELKAVINRECGVNMSFHSINFGTRNLDLYDGMKLSTVGIDKDDLTVHVVAKSGAGSVVINAASVEKVLRCDKCGLEIESGAYSTFEGKTFHAKCFVCSRCRKEFKDKHYVKLDGTVVCTSCHEAYVKATSSKCKKCKKPITGTIVRFRNEEYHDACLVCNSCSCKLTGSIYTDDSDKPYCIDCYTKKNSKKCKKCTRPIPPQERSVVYDDKHYHKECFICDICKRQITADESFFKAQKDKKQIACKNCAH